MSVSVECIVDCHARLGEGAIWDSGDQALWWVDIKAGEIHRYDRQVVLTDFTTGENLSPVWRGEMPVGW